MNDPGYRSPGTSSDQRLESPSSNASAKTVRSSLSATDGCSSHSRPACSTPLRATRTPTPTPSCSTRAQLAYSAGGFRSSIGESRLGSSVLPRSAGESVDRGRRTGGSGWLRLQLIGSCRAGELLSFGSVEPITARGEERKLPKARFKPKLAGLARRLRRLLIPRGFGDRSSAIRFANVRAGFPQHR